jgi:hypothetical protein
VRVVRVDEGAVRLLVTAHADDPAREWDLSCDLLEKSLARLKAENIALPAERTSGLG